MFGGGLIVFAVVLLQLNQKGASQTNHS
jgi:hypothetical protein